MISVGDLLKGLFQGAIIAWPIFGLIGLILIGKVVLRVIEKRRLAESGINDINKMDGKTFEKYLEVLFERLGYNVERTRYVGDYGADLVTVKDGVKTVIQAKRYKNKVNIKAIQEAVAAKGYYGCSEGMVVTNSFYTNQAIELAKANGIKLWDRNDLMKALLSVKKNDSVSILSAGQVAATKEDVLSSSAVSQDVCAFCGRKVTERVRKYCLSNQDKFGGKIYCFEHQKN